MRLYLLLIIIPLAYSKDLNTIFKKVNDDALKYYQMAANLAWETSVCPGNANTAEKAALYQKRILKWQRNTCMKLKALYTDNLMASDVHKRETYLLCKGPIFKYEEAKEVSFLYDQLQNLYYESEVCIPIVHPLSDDNLHQIEDAILKFLAAVEKNAGSNSNNTASLAAEIAINDYSNLEKIDVVCLKGEDTFQRLMQFSKEEMVLKWLWMVWRNKVTPGMRAPYSQMIDLQNRAAKRNGYLDIGQSWREDLEIPNLRELSHGLFKEIKPMYSLLHGVARFFLRKKYGDVVPKRGPIPAHLFGDLWSQNWESLADLIVERELDLDQKIYKLKWTVLKMLKKAEDFYRSLGLPQLPDSFWEKSVFSRRTYESTRCHGTAADMFRKDDYRLLYCSGISLEDFYVIHHELGHIQYYMAYERQPTLFRQANSALHETIGDAMFYGVMTPQHLHRLRLINDSMLYTMGNETTETTRGVFVDKDGYVSEDFGISTDVANTSSDVLLLLRQALNKLPQIPFAMLMEEYRWRFFEGDIPVENMNREFWKLAEMLQGISPPDNRDEKYFDAGAKFHVPDNTPYIRYFLSSFLQHQLFESLCKAAVFGRRDILEDLPSTIPMNRCDIYGSKAAGKLLKDLMSRGHSQHWREILHATTGKDHISVQPLKRYYRPLFKFLSKLIRHHHIPIGW